MKKSTAFGGLESSLSDKKRGGLGIRKAKDMNKALVAKVGWRLMHDQTSLWAKVLQFKYRVNQYHDLFGIVNQSCCSAVWRSIKLGAREVLRHGLSWVIGDGREIRFWQDNWLHNDPINNAIVSPLPTEMFNITARDLWIDGGGWDVHRIHPYITERKRLELSSVVIDCSGESRDRLSWSEDPRGIFTVKSAYHLLTRDSHSTQDMSAFFNCIWSLRVPERIRTFLWLLGNQALMTNAERYMRHIGDSEVCQVCRGGIETSIHVLRDCPAASGIWLRIVPIPQQQVFFSYTSLEWLFSNLKDGRTVGDCPWNITFAVICWWAWKWRCGNVFGIQKLCRDRIGFVKAKSKEVFCANEAARVQSGAASYVDRLVCWEPPSVGWFKVNTDGASRGNPGLATAGGVIRDGDGNWICGFALNIGVCTAPLAELWGVYYGLRIAWDKGLRQVELAVDSKMVVGFLTTGISEFHPLSFLVRLCYGFISRDWRVRIGHVYRESNRLADGLANLAFDLPVGLFTYDFVPESVALLFRDDLEGFKIPRQVRL